MRYFYHVRDHRDFIDRTGVELEGSSAARKLAIHAAGEMLRENEEIWNGGLWKMTVKDENDVIVCELKFSANKDVVFDMSRNTGC